MFAKQISCGCSPRKLADISLWTAFYEQQRVGVWTIQVSSGISTTITQFQFCLPRGSFIFQVEAADLPGSCDHMMEDNNLSGLLDFGSWEEVTRTFRSSSEGCSPALNTWYSYFAKESDSWEASQYQVVNSFSDLLFPQLIWPIYNKRIWWRESFNISQIVGHSEFTSFFRLLSLYHRM